MKTQIIQLEPHDDVISARDKMGWGKSGRVLLVWPERGEVLTRQLDLVLLQRHSASLGTQMALITTDPEVRQEAGALGIPVYKNLKQARSASWRPPRSIRRSQSWRAIQLRREENPPLAEDLRSQRPEQTHPETPLLARLAIFSLGVLALLVLAAFLLPGARITLVPASQPQEVTIPVRADSQVERVSLAGVIPASTLTAAVEGRDQIELSGSMPVPYKPASGSLVFTNLTDQAVKIPKGLVVRNLSDPPVRFATNEAGSLLAGPGTQITLTAQALSPGVQGNLAAGELVGIEGSLGVQLSAHNPKAMRGGLDLQSAAPTQDDYRRLSQRLGESLRQTALTEMRSTTQTGDLIFDNTLLLNRTLEEAFQPASIEPANTLSLGQRLEFQALSASHQDLQALAEAVLNASLPHGYSPVEGSLEIQPLSPPKIAADGGVEWRMRAVRQIQVQHHAGEVASLSQGLPPDQAAARLSASLDLASPPHIDLWPRWWPRLPFLPLRIQVASSS